MDPDAVSPAMKSTKASADAVPEIKDLLGPPAGSGSSKEPAPQRKSAASAAPVAKKPVIKPSSSKSSISKPGISKPTKAPAKASSKPPSATSVATNALAALQSKIASGSLAAKKAPEKAPAPAPAPEPVVALDPPAPSPTLAPGEVAAGVQYPDQSARTFLHIEGAPDITVGQALEDLHPRVLTMEEKNAVGMPLPVVLYDVCDANQVFVPITFKKSGQSAQSPFSGECVMFATIYERTPPGFENGSSVLDLDKKAAECTMRGLKEYTAWHIAASDPKIAEIFWRLKWQFPQFEWEPAASADVKSFSASARVDVKILNLPHAPAHIKDDLAKLPLPKPSTENAVRSARWHKWVAAVKDAKWVHPQGRPPCHPLPPHDKRAEKLGSRTSLTTAVNAYLRSPGRIDLKGFSIGSLLQTFIERAPAEPMAEESEVPKRSAEEDEMAAMLEPPSKPEKKNNKRKLKKGSSFVDGEADYDECEDGHSDDEEEGEDGLGDFVRDDSSELSEHDSLADDLDERKKKKKKSKPAAPPKKKARVITDSDEDESDGEEDDEEGGGGEESDEEEEEMQDSDDDDDDDDESEEEEDTREVKARAEASDDSGDDEPDRSNGKKTGSASKKSSSGDKRADAPGQRSIASIFAAQQMENTQPIGKPGLKLGAKAAHKLSAAEKQADVSDKGPPVAKKPHRVAPPKATAPQLAVPRDDEGQDAEAARQEPSSRAGATIKRNGMADKAKSAVGIILSNKKLSSASPAFAQEIKQGARKMGALMEEFRDNEYKPHAHACMESMVELIENMAYVVNGLTQNQDKTKDTLEAHGELGVIGAKMLSEMMPDVLEVQKRVNALAATGNGMTTQFALAVAKAKQAEK